MSYHIIIVKVAELRIHPEHSKVCPVIKVALLLFMLSANKMVQVIRLQFPPS